MLSATLMYRLRTALEYHQMTLRMEEVGGFLDNMQGYVLLLLADQGPGAGEIVEIGSFKGKSTCWLAYGAKASGREKVTAVDTFAGSPEHQAGGALPDRDLMELGSTFPVFQANLARMELDDYVTPIVSASREAAQGWNRPIRLLFIDADHSYDATREDFELWSPHVVPGGIIAFHDVGDWEGVTRFYQELMASTSEYVEVLSLFGMAVIEKKR